MSESRTKNTKRNIIFSYIDTIIMMVFSFVSKSLIVHILGDQYLGLSGLFSSILTVLNMAELGFSSAIIFNMYKPLAEGNTERVCALLGYYRKIYRIVGCAVIAVGVCISPFLPGIIHGEIPADVNLYILYYLYLANTAISYLVFAYKTALLEALQRLDLTKIAYSIVNISQYILQIILLLTTKNYYAFVIVMLFATVGRNLLAAWIADKKFPQYRCAGTVEPETRKDIFRRVRGLLIGNISGVTYTTLDSIILSSFVGLTAVAIYNNYYSICSYIMSFIVMIRGAMQASVGNSVAKESVEKNYQDMMLWHFMFAMISTWCVTCLMSLYQPFMTLWMGEERLLTMTDVSFLCIWFFITTSQHSFFLYSSGSGLWWEMRWPYILSTVSNLLLNILLGQKYGVTGILFASAFSSCVFGLIWQCAIVFKKYFHRSMREFQIHELLYFAVCAVSCAAGYFLNSLIPVSGILGLVIRFVICTLVSGGLIFLVYGRTAIFRRARTFILSAVKKA